MFSIISTNTIFWIFFLAVSFYLLRRPIGLIRNLLELLKLLLEIKWKGRSISHTNQDTKPGSSFDTVSPWSILSEWSARVQSTPDNQFIEMVPNHWDEQPRHAPLTYRQADELSNRIGHILQNLVADAPESVVAVFLPPSPFYVACWLGIVKAGATAGLINTNLRGKPLAHAIRAGPGILIVQEGDLRDHLEDHDVRAVLEELSIRIIVKESHQTSGGYRDADDNDNSSLDRLLVSAPATTLRSSIPPPSTLFFIYTSGTTGLPKASRFTHLRFWAAGRMLATLGRVRADDRIYCALPLYHSAGGCIGVSACILTGSCLVLREKFSGSKFSEDLVRGKCTIVQYIGEFARFALSAKKNDEMERILRDDQNVRVAFGNGMRKEVWEDFRTRFGIQRVVEFYGSTEGNVGMVNNTPKIGAIGIIPAPLSFLYPVMLVKTDPVSNEILRHPTTQRAIPCRPNQPGQLIGLISDSDPARRFDGYTDVAATQKMIARDVWKKGDAWFLSGDLLKRDRMGFYYFVDRLGDTFRWKGENVSTAEVTNALEEEAEEANVYGVEVQGYPGRAGMARVVRVKVEFHVLYERLVRKLPLYAVPLFIRVGAYSAFGKEGLMTDTFKHKKKELKLDGFSPKMCSEETVFYRDDRKKTFVMLTEEGYKDICSGKIRV